MDRKIEYNDALTGEKNIESFCEMVKSLANTFPGIDMMMMQVLEKQEKSEKCYQKALEIIGIMLTQVSSCWNTDGEGLDGNMMIFNLQSLIRSLQEIDKDLYAGFIKSLNFVGTLKYILHDFAEKKNAVQSDFCDKELDLGKIYQKNSIGNGLEGEIMEKDMKIDYLTQKIKVQMEAYENLAKQLLSLESKNLEQSTQESKMVEKINILTENLKKQEQMIAKKFENSLESKDYTILELKNQISTLNKQFKESKKKYEQEIKDLDDEITTEKNRNYDLMQKILTGDKEKMSINDKIRELNTDILEKETFIQELEEDHKLEIDHIKTQFYNRINKLQKDLHDQKMKNTEIEEILGSKRPSIIDIRDSLFNEISDFPELPTNQASLIHSISNMSTDYSVLEELTSKLKDSEVSQMSLNQKIEQLESKLQECIKVNNSLKCQLNNVIIENKLMSKELDLFKSKTCDSSERNSVMILQAEISSKNVTISAYTKGQSID
ncbi:hypothetical protein SteCoe_10361 [Stentor coeruleus]|uniref:Uncharacterized protein n=1 Tax=Stentor coeruleus TaxID=5963 RepID=A0A1R2CFT8_9CILI|nr:hypothetical protein SteCoe_10361 [Stentor coeruleus]